MNVNPVTDINGILAAAAAENTSAASNTYFSNYMDQASLNYGNYLEQIFQKASDTYGVSKDLLKAMAKAESNFQANATSHCGAMGIMQLMPATASSLGVSDAYDPEQNIMGGAQYMSRLLEKYNGNLSYAIAAYNAGSGNVDKYGGIPPFNETQNYVAKVLRYLEEGVTIPDSSGTSAPSGAASVSAEGSQAAGTSGSTLQDVLNKYFDYDDYLEFLQLFTRVIYEKLTGSELETDAAETPDQAAKQEQGETAAVQQETLAAPAKLLTMKVADARGQVSTYQQPGASGQDVHRAFQYMTAGGQKRMSVFLNKTV